MKKKLGMPCARRVAVCLLAPSLATISACAPHVAAPIYCVTPEQLQKLRDAEPPKVGQTLTGQAQEDIRIIAGSNVELRSYGHGLLGVIAGCTGQ